MQIKSLLIAFVFLAVLTGTVSAQKVVFSQNFISGAGPASQCVAWTAFRASLDLSGNYTKMIIRGTYDVNGQVLTDKTEVNNFAAAIKNNTSYITSGSFNGHVWSICNRDGGELWLDPPSLCSGSNCPGPNAYIIRPCIGNGTNSNWGGVNSNTCSPPSQLIELIFEMPEKPNDAGISKIYPPICGTNLWVTYNNYGVNDLDSAKIQWSVDGASQPDYNMTTLLAQGDKPVDILLDDDYPFIDGNTYVVKVWTSAPNNATDSVPENDTAVLKFKYIAPTNAPTTTNTVQCGVGPGKLMAKTASQFDSVTWYDAPTGGKIIANGKNAASPFLQYGVHKFYAEAYKVGPVNAYGNTMSGGTLITGNTGYYNGGMFDITPNADMFVDSFTIRFWQYIPNSTYSVYFRQGSYNGYQTTPSAWTQIVSDQRARVTTNGNRAYLAIPTMLLKSGVQYAFYITTTTTTGNEPWSNWGSSSFSNADMSINFGSYLYGPAGPFANGGGWYSNHTIDAEVNYRLQLCPATRVLQDITVNPSPTGAQIIQGTPFRDHFKAGVGSDPDITSATKTITYEFTPPTGYTNSDYGVKWTLQSLTLVADRGYVIPSGEYTITNPTGSANGMVSFTAPKKYVDSTITFHFKYADLGPYFCDSTVKRVLYVAPTPKPNFTFPGVICDGSFVFFDNISEISKGTMTHKWYFGDGDSSDNVTPIHQFPAPGTYSVTLVSTSVKFGVSYDTTISVVIADLPKVVFKPTNACEGNAVTFTNSSTVANGTLSYSWDFGDNSALSTQPNPNHQYSTPGAYKTTLTVTSNKGCVNSLVKNVYTFARPKAGFVAPSASICAGTPVVMANTSVISNGDMGSFWTFGDGTTSTANTGSHAYTAAGTYNVKLKMVSEFGCEDEITKQVNIKASPVVSFNVGRTCSLEPTIFTNTTPVTTGDAYTWTFSEGASASTPVVSHNWATVGPKTATLKVSGTNGCSSVVTKEFEVLVQPDAKFTVADICSGEQAIFENQTTVVDGDVENTWDFGDNSPVSNISDPEHQYNVTSTTTINVMLVAKVAGGCADTAQEVITISALPVCDFTKEVNWASGYRSIRFIPANSTYQSYSWQFGDGSTSSSTSPVYPYVQDGLYKVKLRAKNAAGCECESTMNLQVANLGVGELDASAVSIYPNPNNGKFIIELSDDESSSEIEIYNTLGERIYTGVTVGGSTEIDLSSAAKGIYIVKVKTKGKTSTRKVSVN